MIKKRDVRKKWKIEWFFVFSKCNNLNLIYFLVIFLDAKETTEYIDLTNSTKNKLLICENQEGICCSQKLNKRRVENYPIKA